MVMFWADIFPGARVLEAGDGLGRAAPSRCCARWAPRARSSATSSARTSRAARWPISTCAWARSTNLAVRLRPVEEGLAEEEPVDRVVFDLPEPWQLVEPVAARAPRRAASSSPIVPTIIQSHQLTESAAPPSRLRARRDLRDAAPALEHRGHVGAPVPSDGRAHRVPHRGPARGAGGGLRPPAARRACPGATEACSSAGSGSARAGTTVGGEVRGRLHHLHGHGLHHLREPGDPVLRRHPGARGQGPPFAATQAATCLVAGVMTIAWGSLPTIPLALASGMGLNAVVAFQLVAGAQAARGRRRWAWCSSRGW